MTVTVDLERRLVTAGVGDLLGETATRAIGLSGSGLTRLWIGSELHRRIQQSLVDDEPDYRAEVALELEHEVDGWTVRLSGRADGVAYREGRAARVDEIKTLHFAVDLHNLYAEERLDRYRRQAALYAFMAAGDDPPPTVRLILVDIVTTEARDEEVPWSPDEVRAWLRQQVHRLVAREQRRLRRLEELRASAELIPFPHPETRPAQVTIGDAVAETLELGRHLLVRAPTGCGKTAAVLHPALKAALALGHRLFVLTAKTLQQKIAVDTARAMQDGLFRSLQLRAKRKMCANAEMICHEEFCPYAREYGVKLVRSQLVETLLADRDHQDPDQVFGAARNHEMCPFEVSLDLLPHVDLVVCDYNYVFDPVIGLGAVLHEGALRNAVLVIDEAHNLVDRSREYYSPEIRAETLERADEYLQTRSNPVFDDLAALVRELAGLVDTWVDDAFDDDRAGEVTTIFDPEAVADLRIAFDGAMLSYFLYKREHELWIADDPVLELFFELSHFHRVLALGGDEFVHLARRAPDRRASLRIFCLDASRFVGEILDESAGTVAMSATLEPFDFYRDLLGFDPHRTSTLYVPSPFPAENRLVLAIDDVDTTWKRRAAHYDRIASWIGRLAHPRSNVLVLFPSYAFLDAVSDRLSAPRHRLLVQRPGSSDGDQREFLAALGNGDPHLLLAVLGGIFAEGVDYPGRMLSQVIVVSPGLPQFNLERELLKAYYQEIYGHGFGYAYLIPGMTRVVQAAGRLIRSDTDRGVITLVGRRFLDPRYARLLPEEWLDGDPTCLLNPDPERAVRDFFDGDPGDPGVY
ncbi:MAG TPA: helicase C-terminal domain-containing protein [Methylomirabilota bacterium]|nr:helicase C-terminal domain-containing protein [Methylomirabilota bacterium]